jgi:hypothetical protein
LLLIGGRFSVATVVKVVSAMDAIARQSCVEMPPGIAFLIEKAALLERPFEMLK